MKAIFTTLLSLSTTGAVFCAVDSTEQKKPVERRYTVGADFIYWTMRQIERHSNVRSQLGSGSILAGSDNDPALIQYTTGEDQTRTFNNHFDPGFKIYAGMTFAHDLWDTLLRYTWLHSKNTQRLRGNDQGSVIIDNIGISSTNLDGTTKYRFNNFDWELGRLFHPSPMFTLRPYTGLKGGWEAQRNTENYGRNFFDEEGDLANDALSAVISKAKSDIWWIGIRNGLDLEFFFTKNWDLIGKTAFSGIWEGLKDQRYDTIYLTADGNVDGTAVAVQANNFTYRQHVFTGVLEFQIGLAYHYFWSTNNEFSVTAAWEGQLWMNQSGSTSTAEGLQLTDIFMQGLTLGFAVKF